MSDPDELEAEAAYETAIAAHEEALEAELKAWIAARYCAANPALRPTHYDN